MTYVCIDSNSNSSAPYIWNRGNQTAVVGSSVTIVFLTTNVDGFLFWKNHRDVIQTGMGSRYDNTMNGYLTIRDVVKEDEGWITLQAMNTTTRQEVTASLYLKVVPGKQYIKSYNTVFALIDSSRSSIHREMYIKYIHCICGYRSFDFSHINFHCLPRYYNLDGLYY